MTPKMCFDNDMKFWLAFCLVLTGTAILVNNVITAPHPTHVSAYYYTWYKKGDWTDHRYFGQPILGEYGSDAPQTAEQHITWANHAKIDSFTVSWWGPSTLPETYLRTGLLKAKNISQIKLMLHYESLGRLDAKDGAIDQRCDFANETVTQQFINDLQYLNDNFFHHPSYYKINNKPVLVLYVTRTFKNFTPTKLETIRKKLGFDLYLIADEVFFNKQSSPSTAVNKPEKSTLRGFDAYTAYNMFENDKVIPGETAYDYQYREAMPIYRKWAMSSQFFPNIMPMYSDFRGHKQLQGNDDGFRLQIQMVKKLRNTSLNKPFIIFVTSFNEWWEGSSIEPTLENKDIFLNVLRTELNND